MNNPFPKPQRVLAIVAHPDDPEFGAGGTIARWVRSGSQVTYVIVTDGSKGSNDPEMTSERLVQVRQTEQRAAARVLGVPEVVFLGYPDSTVYDTLELRRELVRQIRLHRPDVVVTHDPTARFISYAGHSRLSHPDHRAVGDAALDAVFPLARGRLNFPEHEGEGLVPHKVLDIFLTSTNEPNEWVDITETIEQKIAALWEHRSQIGDPEALATRIRAWAREMAACACATPSAALRVPAGAGEGTLYIYAECFRRITLSE
jgi:LmbE family N-acetylglucosaminyl deacetylase